MRTGRVAGRMHGSGAPEELDVDADAGEEIFTTTHAYSDRTVELHFLKCELRGTPTPQVGQELRWVAREELAALQFPPRTPSSFGG